MRGRQEATEEEARPEDVELPGRIVKLLGEILKVRRFELVERVVDLEFHLRKNGHVLTTWTVM